jgi:hypothetical protein
VYSSKLPKIKRFINIYQSNGKKKETNKQKHDHTSLEPIKIHDSSPIDPENNENDSESSQEIIAGSCETSQNRNNHNIDDSTSGRNFTLNRPRADKHDRSHTITPEIPVKTSLPDINTSITARNIKKVIQNNKKGKHKIKAIGKPPLWIVINKKNSVYPDISNFKAGTANNKILQLRQHLTRTNTVSNPNLLKEEQAMIDSMFSEHARQASRERDGYASGINSGTQKHIKKKRTRTKAPSQFKNRAISSDIEPTKKNRNTSLSKELTRDNSRKGMKQESKLFQIQPSQQYINHPFIIGRQTFRQDYETNWNDNNTHKRPSKKEISK